MNEIMTFHSIVSEIEKALSQLRNVVTSSQTFYFVRGGIFEFWWLESIAFPNIMWSDHAQSEFGCNLCYTNYDYVFVTWRILRNIKDS